MAEKKQEEKTILEREYVIPLKRKILRAPEYKRVPKAIKVLKEFIAKHMKLYDRDLRKVKLDKWLNNELWFRGIRKPAAKIKVKAKKLSSGNVLVELSEIPQALKWKIEKEKKLKEKSEGKKEEEKKEEEKEKETEKKIEEKEKEEAIKLSELKQAEAKHKEIKHESQAKFKKQTTPKRMALQK